MKYLKLFEGEKEYNEQLEDIEDIFLEYTDGGENAKGYIETGDKNIIISIYKDLPENISCNITDFNNLLKNQENNLLFIKKIRPSLLRLDYLKYEWTLAIYDEEITIRILKTNNKLTLQDAFGGESRMNHVDEGIMKKVLKRDYDIDYSNSIFKPSTSGFYGKRAEISIYLSENIYEDNKLIKDLKEAKRIYKYTSSLVKGEQVEEKIAFYKIEITNWDNRSMIKIEVSQ